MIDRIIDYSLKNRFLIILLTLAVVLTGIHALFRIPVDAIPDLSDVQVIVYTEYSGQAPQVVEDQVTYPLTSALLSVPSARNVRGFSFFGFSMIYVIFDEGTDIYWARSRVLEYLSSASDRLPGGVSPTLGPDASGVGWVYMYTVTDRTGRYDLQQLRSIQDWQIRYELASIQGVSEVASVGGYVKQYQVEVDPTKLILYGITLQTLRKRIADSNGDSGGRLLELGETEFMVRSPGYFQNISDIEAVVLRSNKDGNPVTVGDVARVQIGPEIRRGIAEWNGDGETVAGIVVMRYGENALEVIDRVKQRLIEIRPSLPEGVEIETGYDRSLLINRAIRNIGWKLAEEMFVVALVIIVFLLHGRSSLVAIATLPVGVLASLGFMYYGGMNANIMSLGGIAIAVGVMVDASVVMVENLHKHMEAHPDSPHIELVRNASREVGPALFFSLLIIAVSFLPVLILDGQSGRLFKPLAVTKTVAMAFSSVIAITVIPVLMSWFVKGPIRRESDNPISQFLIRVYTPLLEKALDKKREFLIGSGIFLLISLLPITGIPSPSGGYLIRPAGGEFMPPLNEGDILYMPTTLPGISITKARELLQKTDAIIKQTPEVNSVLGKVGRARTATDPAPLTMIETTIQLKPRSEWRSGFEIEDIIQELDKNVRFPGLTNSWTMPIKTRIDMLTTGIKTPVGIKLLGDDLAVLAKYGSTLEALLKDVPGTASVVSERVMGGRYIDIDVNRRAAGRYGLTPGDIRNVVETAIGGQNVTYTVEGLARYPVNVRYPRELRDTISSIKDVYVTTPTGASIPLSQVADISISEGPPGIKTENARKTAWIYIDLKPGMDVSNYVKAAKRRIRESIEKGNVLHPPGVTLIWSGQYEYMRKAAARIMTASTVALLIVVLLLYFHFQNITETLIIIGSLSFAVSGGIWMMYILGYNRSIATDVGFIALAGLAAETGIVMLVYLDGAIRRMHSGGMLHSPQQIRAAIMEGAVSRVRPKIMTVATTMLGLIPIMWATESGARIMKRLATPMIGGLFTSTILTLILIPVIYELIQLRRLKKGEAGPFRKDSGGI